MALSFGFRRRKKASDLDQNAKAALARIADRPVVLIGLMGAGKTSVGRILAHDLGLNFVDADNEIEKAAGMSITDIFDKHGEEYFRNGERRVIARLMGNGAQVLATGGGAFMSEETRNVIQENGISVWLKADLDVLMRRVLRRNTRPLLLTDDPQAVMQSLLTERYPVYSEADITVQSRDVPHQVIVDEIIKALGETSDPAQSTGTSVES